MSGCGKRAMPMSLSQAGRMTNTQLMEFIMDNAPVDVSTKMLDEHITSRSGLCKLLDSFAMGRAIKREGRSVRLSKNQAATRIQRVFRRASAAHAFNLRHAMKRGSGMTAKPIQQIFASGFMVRPVKKLKRVNAGYNARAYQSVPLNYRHMVRSNAKKASTKRNRTKMNNLARARAERKAFEELNWGSNGSRSTASSARSNGTMSSGSGSNGSGSNRLGSGSGSNGSPKGGNRGGAAPTKGGNLRKRPENKDPRLGVKTRFSGLRRKFRRATEKRGKRFTNFSHELYFGSENEKRRKKKLKNPRKASKRDTNSNRALMYRGLNLPKAGYSSSSSSESPMKPRRGRFVNLAAHRYYSEKRPTAMVHTPKNLLKYPKIKAPLARRETASRRVISTRGPITKKQREVYENLKRQFFAGRNKSRMPELFGSSSNSSSNSNTNKQLMQIMEGVRRNYPSKKRVISMGFPNSGAFAPREALTQRKLRVKKATYKKLAVNLLSKMNINKIKGMKVSQVKKMLANKMGLVNSEEIPALGKVINKYMAGANTHKKSIQVRKILKRKPNAGKYHPGPSITKLTPRSLFNSNTNVSPSSSNRLSNVD